MQSASSRIWTRVAGFISCDDNHDTTSTSNKINTYNQFGSLSLFNGISTLASHLMSKQSLLKNSSDII